MTGLARALDNARILREFKHDDRAAFRALKSALTRRQEPAVERALVLCHLVELATFLDGPEAAEVWTAQLGEVTLTETERQRVIRDAADVGALRQWLA